MGMSGATIVTNDEKGKWTMAVEFRSFESVPNAALEKVELPDVRILEDMDRDIRRGKALEYYICGGRTLPSDIKNNMEIVNDRHKL